MFLNRGIKLIMRSKNKLKSKWIKAKEGCITGNFSATASTGFWNGHAKLCFHNGLSTLFWIYLSWLVIRPVLWLLLLMSGRGCCFDDDDEEIVATPFSFDDDDIVASTSFDSCLSPPCLLGYLYARFQFHNDVTSRIL